MESGTSFKNHEDTIWMTLLILFFKEHRGVIFQIVCTFNEKFIDGIKFTILDKFGSKLKVTKVMIIFGRITDNKASVLKSGMQHCSSALSLKTHLHHLYQYTF